jgi:hypothetical protein
MQAERLLSVEKKECLFYPKRFTASIRLVTGVPETCLSLNEPPQGTTRNVTIKEGKWEGRRKIEIRK